MAGRWTTGAAPRRYLPGVGTPSVRPSALDVAAAAGVLAVAVLEATASEALSLTPSQAAALVLVAAPLAWRRVRPLTTLVLVCVGVSLSSSLAPEAEVVSTFAAIVLACWSVAAYRTRRGALAGLAVAIGFFVAGTVVDNLRDPGSRPLGDLLYVTVALSGAWATGRIVRRWRDLAATLAQRTVELEQEREWRARAAVAEERARIARELHDVVAHSVSVMVVQAAAAAEVLGCAPDRARAPLEQIQDTGRQAVLELRHLLGILRPGEEGEGSAPQPTLRDLDELVAGARAAGLHVDVQVDGTLRELPPGIGLTAYRIVQEALTNVVKHAGPTAAEVRVRHDAESLRIDVVDRGGRGEHVGSGTGMGLVGMRERVALYDGELDAGPDGAGGYAVRARLPL